MAKKNLCFRSHKCLRDGDILPPMDVKYYTHFVLTELGGSGFGEFTGVVHVDRGIAQGMIADEARYLLAQNLDVDVDDVHVIHWSHLH